MFIFYILACKLIKFFFNFQWHVIQPALGFLLTPRTSNGVAMVDRPHYRPTTPILLTANLVFFCHSAGSIPASVSCASSFEMRCIIASRSTCQSLDDEEDEDPN